MADTLDILLVGEGDVPRDRIDAELARSGLAYTLSEARNEAEMLAVCRSAPPDVIVAADSDQTFDAVAALAIARELCSDAPLIVIANAAGEEVVVEALHAGVTDYVIADRLSRLGPALERAVREHEAEAERRAAERAVREAEARFRAVFENAPVGIAIRADGRVLLVNQGYLEMFGASDIEDLPAGHLEDGPADQERPGDPGGTATHEGVGVRADGGTFPYELRVARMALGDVQATVSFVADISERKATEHELDRYRKDLERMVRERTDELMAANRRLQEATRTRIRFLASMSHELRTPLNSVIGFAGVLLQELSGPLNEEQRRQLAIIHDAGRRLMDTIDDVLDVSRIEAGKAELEWEQFELDTTLRALADGVRAELEGKGLELRLLLPRTPLPVVSDRRKITQIVRGLLDNAIKFTSEGDITLALEADHKTVRVRVADTGIGIPGDELPYVFEEFRQVRAADGTRPEGAGLGLSICSKLAGLLGGSLTAQSTLGAGSEFLLALPVGPVVDLGGGRS